jgi:hypothetical protein
MNFFAELKRRNVFRMAALYLVGAWLIVQVTGTVLPMFEAPPWLPRGIVILLAVGFIPMLVFSWVFELTPAGIKRDAEVKPEESIAPQTARRMDRLIIAKRQATMSETKEPLNKLSSQRRLGSSSLVRLKEELDSRLRGNDEERVVHAFTKETLDP